MRMLLAVTLVIMGGTLALNAPAVDAASKAKRTETKRIAKPSYKKQRPRYYSYPREAVECERAHHADPTGRFSGYPCWAQEALSPKGGNDRN
jgi:hypothetical protein